MSIPPIPVRRFSVTEYQRLFATGTFTESDKIELLDGWITPKMTRNAPHDGILPLIADAIAAQLPANWLLRQQSSLIMTTSVPEPDFAVVAGPARRYLTQHPTPADVALLIEVADSSLAHDRDVKGPLYAAAGIAVYWIANVPDRTIEVYTGPTPTGYQNRQENAIGDAVPVVIAGNLAARVSVADLLG